SARRTEAASPATERDDSVPVAKVPIERGQAEMTAGDRDRGAKDPTGRGRGERARDVRARDVRAQGERAQGARDRGGAGPLRFCLRSSATNCACRTNSTSNLMRSTPKSARNWIRF